MSKKIISPNFVLKNLKFIYIANSIGTFFLILVSVVISILNFNESLYLPTWKFVIIALFALISIFLAQSFYKSTIKNITNKDSLAIKIQKYQSANVLRLTILDSTLFIHLLFLVFTKEKLIMLLTLFIFIAILSQKPDKVDFFKEIKLTNEEKDLLNN